MPAREVLAAPVPRVSEDRLRAVAADLERQLELLEKYSIDFIALARYMQILSDDFVGSYPQRIINIHHSFLPGFKGARPYHQAFLRGVKLIGVDSVMCPKPRREKAWARLASDLDMSKLDALTTHIKLEDVIAGAVQHTASAQIQIPKAAAIGE